MWAWASSYFGHWNPQGWTQSLGAPVVCITTWRIVTPCSLSWIPVCSGPKHWQIVSTFCNTFRVPKTTSCLTYSPLKEIWLRAIHLSLTRTGLLCALEWSLHQKSQWSNLISCCLDSKLWSWVCIHWEYHNLLLDSCKINHVCCCMCRYCLPSDPDWPSSTSHQCYAVNLGLHINRDLGDDHVGSKLLLRWPGITTLSLSSSLLCWCCWEPTTILGRSLPWFSHLQPFWVGPWFSHPQPGPLLWWCAAGQWRVGVQRLGKGWSRVVLAVMQRTLLRDYIPCECELREVMVQKKEWQSQNDPGFQIKHLGWHGHKIYLAVVQLGSVMDSP